MAACLQPGNQVLPSSSACHWTCWQEKGTAVTVKDRLADVHGCDATQLTHRLKGSGDPHRHSGDVSGSRVCVTW